MAVYKREWKNKQGKTCFCWYFHKTINGVRYRARIPSARTKAQAEEAERKCLAEIHDGTYGKPKSKATFKEFVEKVFLPWSRDNRKSFRSDESRCKALVAFFGRYELAEITAFLIERFKSERRKSKTERKGTRSIATVNRELQLLYRIFQIAKGKREIASNPRDEVQLIKGENPRDRWLRPEEKEKLFEQFTGRRSHLIDIIELDLNLGLRKTNLLSLRPEHVDFHRGIVRATNTKTGKDYDVPINNTAREILRRLVDQAEAEGFEYLFINPKTGTRYRDVKRAFRSALKDAGIKDFRFHDLRHTFGTRAADSGAPLTAIRDTLGHASIETTNRYAHATEEGMRRVVEAQETEISRPGHIAVTKEVESMKKRAV
jgi:integrase